jgi:putative transposase
MRQTYPTDLSDAEWHLLARLIPAPKSGGRPLKYSRREIVNAILYVVHSGAAGRLVPHDLPAWVTGLSLLSAAATGRDMATHP